MASAAVQRAKHSGLLTALAEFESRLNPENKVELKAESATTIKWLLGEIAKGPGAPGRRRLATCVASLLNVVGTGALAEVLHKSIELVKTKDDAAGPAPRLAGLEVIGRCAVVLGRALSVLIVDLIKELARVYKMFAGDVRTKVGILYAFKCIATGVGSGAAGAFKDMFKTFKSGLADKAVDVRTASASCVHAMAASTNWLQQNELESTVACVLKALDGSSHLLRREAAGSLGTVSMLAIIVLLPHIYVFHRYCAARVNKACPVAQLLGSLQSQATWIGSKAKKRPGVDEASAMLADGFIRGSREVRVGVAQAYVAYLTALGATWVEKQVAALVPGLLQLLSQTKLIASTKDEALCSRRCVLHIIITVLGRTLGETGRTNTILALCRILQVPSESSPNGKRGSSGGDADSSEHRLMCALDAIAELVVLVGSPIAAEYEAVMKPLLQAATHTSAGVRFAAAHCLRSLSGVVPSRASFLANKCLDRLSATRASPDMVHGIGHALAAVVGGSAASPLGLPHELAASVLKVGEQLVTVGTAAPPGPGCFAAALASVDAGWALIGSLTSLGTAAVAPHASHFAALWTSVFPAKRQESQKLGVEAWLLVLHSRIGALASAEGFLIDCKELATTELTKLVARCLTSAVALLAEIPAPNKANLPMHGANIKMRLRLYSLFLLLPVRLYEDVFSSVLPYLVADITLVEASAASTGSTSSLLRSMCHDGDGVLLGEAINASDERLVEELLAGRYGGRLGALENDPGVLVLPSGRYTSRPLPVHVGVIDKAVLLFGTIYPYLGSQKHRNQLLEHLSTCVRAAKVGSKRDAIQINIFTAFLAALKQTVMAKATLGSGTVVNTARSLALDAIASPDETLRCAAGEALGRMAQVIGGQFASEMIRVALERLQKDGNVFPRTGFSLALGCIHRYVGGMGSGAGNLNQSVAILQALADDVNPLVRMWALHGLMLTVDAAGHRFAEFIPSTIELVRSIVTTAPEIDAQVHHCAGELINTLSGVLGPELQADTSRRSLILQLCRELQSHPDGAVQLAGLHGIQQLAVFAPEHIDLPVFVPHLQRTSTSPHLELRCAAVACIHQICQREPLLVSQHGQKLIEQLFKMLDTENDSRLHTDLRGSIMAMLQVLAAKTPRYWLVLCNDILSGASEKSSCSARANIGGEGSDNDDDDDGDGDGVGDDSDSGGGVDGGDEVGVKMKETVRAVVSTRWQTKVFAVSCVREVMKWCALSSAPHFDLAKARTATGDFLIIHLSEVIRTIFLAATSAITELRLVALEALEDVIQYFAGSVDVDIGGEHSLLEQYQAQVTSALRPAFDANTSPDVTATAAVVIARWITSGVNRSASDHRRVINLLTERLTEIRDAPDPVYNERTTTMLRISLLTAWADIAITASEASDEMHYLQDIVSPHIMILSDHWVAALRDYALVSLPPEYENQIPPQGTFYYPGTRTAALVYYERAFPKLLRAAAIYTAAVAETSDTARGDNFYLLSGLAVRSLSGNSEEPLVMACLLSLRDLIPRSDRLKSDKGVFNELCQLLRGVVQTQSAPVQLASIEVIAGYIKQQICFGNAEVCDVAPGSPTYSAFAFCVSILFKEVPELNPSTTAKAVVVSPPSAVATAALDALADIARLCPGGIVLQVAPAVLAILLRAVEFGHEPFSVVAVQCIQRIVSRAVSNDESISLAETLSACLEAALDALEAAPGSDGGLLLLTVAAIVGAAPSVVLEPKRRAQIGKVIKARCIDTTSPAQQQATVRVITAVVRQPGAAADVFIHDIAPTVAGLLRTAASVKPKTEPELMVLSEVIQLLGALVAQATGNGRTVMVRLMLGLLAGVLDTSAAVTSVSGRLHAAALVSINQIGPAYPAEFKAAIAAKPELAKLITAAVRASAAQQQHQAVVAQPSGTTQNAAAEKGREAAAVKPKIALTMNFSAFS